MSQANFEENAIRSKLFIAHCTERHGEYETKTKRLIISTDAASAEEYAIQEGMLAYDGSDGGDINYYQLEGQPRTWYFCDGDWSVTLDIITEIDNQEHAKIIAQYFLMPYL